MQLMTQEEFEELVKIHSLESDKILDALAFTGEAGEVANEVKKDALYNMIEDYRYRVDEELAEGKREHRHDMVCDEVGDTLFYMVKLLKKYDLTLSDVMAQQKEKLGKQSEQLDKTYKK